MAMRPNELTACAALEELRAGRLTAEALMRACLERIAEREALVQAFAHLDPELALAEARRRDATGARGLLHGLPLGVKDIIDTGDLPTAYGSRVYPGNRPAQDAACVALARAAGAVVLGKTVTAEFAFRAPGPTTNPHDPAHTPGGSSSGSAAAVADFMLPVAFGTQTGGSIIRPASFCGVVGYKPSLGTINRAGVKPLADSFDTVGLFARSVADVALITAVLAGDEPRVFGSSRPGPRGSASPHAILAEGRASCAERPRGQRRPAKPGRRPGRGAGAAGGVRGPQPAPFDRPAVRGIPGAGLRARGPRRTARPGYAPRARGGQPDPEARLSRGQDLDRRVPAVGRPGIRGGGPAARAERAGRGAARPGEYRRCELQPPLDRAARTVPQSPGERRPERVAGRRTDGRRPKRRRPPARVVGLDRGGPGRLTGRGRRGSHGGVGAVGAGRPRIGLDGAHEGGHCRRVATPPDRDQRDVAGDLRVDQRTGL